MVYDADSNNDKMPVIDYSETNRATTQNAYAKAIDNDDHFVWKEIRETIQQTAPRFVGVSIMTPTLHSGVKIIKIAKELGKVVIVGGAHVNIVKEKIFKLNDIDYAVFGEGEIPLEEFLTVYPNEKKLNSIHGLGSTRNESYNGFAPRIQDLDSLPFPDRKLLLYVERFQNSGLNNIIASRGCPYKCDFCASVPLWHRKTMVRSPAHVIEEIKDLHDNYNLKEFRFFDDIFTIKKSNVIEFCQLLISEYGKKYFKWWCYSRVNTIDEEMLSWLKKAGCDQICLGIESGSPAVLKRMHKEITIEQTEKAVELIKKHGFWLLTFFMFGLPYETVENMRETVDFIKRIKPDSINLCTFTPYPGTELYDYCVEKKLLEHDDSYDIFKNIGHHSTYNYFSDTVSQNEYQHHLKIILELSTNVTNYLTWKKCLFRLKHLTFKKIVNKIERILRKGKVLQ